MKTKILSGVILGLSLVSCSKKRIDPAMMGKIERDQIAVVTKVPGTVDSIYVAVGEHVQKGDTLAILAIPEVDAKREQAEGAMTAAEAQYQMAVKGATDGQLRQLQAKVNGLKEQYEYAEKSYERLRKMAEDSLIPQQQFDEVYAKYQGAKNQYEAAVTEWEEAKTGARIEQQTMALGQQRRASGAIREVQVAESEKYMIAPQTMHLETVNLKTGELALAGYPVFSGYISSSVYFRFTIPEKKLGAIKLDQQVSVRVLYGDKPPVAAKVTAIKALSSYAQIATAYPDFDIEQALFEVQVKPLNPEEVKDLITKASVELILNN